MAISPIRIPVQTMERQLQQVARAAEDCIAMIDNVINNHPDQYHLDPTKVKVSRSLSSIEKITIGNTNYLKELLIKQISNEYVKAGWKEADIYIDYRDEVFATSQTDPQTVSIDKIIIDLYFKTEEVTATTTSPTGLKPSSTSIDDKSVVIDGAGGQSATVLTNQELTACIKNIEQRMVWLRNQLP